MFQRMETRRPRLLLVLFCVLLWSPGFFTLPPGDRDESRFAQATKQMLETGDFVRIQNGTEARNRKPIGIYWAQVPFVVAAQALGVAGENPIWPYRLPSALGGLIAVLATFSIGEAMAGRVAGLLAGGLLAASVLLAGEVHIAKTDAALLGSVTLAMGVLARAYLRPATMRAAHAALFWLALAASVLLKGPIGPMVAGLTVATLWLADRRGAWLRALRPAWGVPLFLAAVLPWFVAIGVATGGRFFTDAVGGDLGRKLSSGDDAHWGPPLLHLLLLPALLLPAAALLPQALLRSWRERSDPVLRFLLAWAGPSWIVFEAVPTKLPHYPLPLYPALCLLAALWTLRPDRRPIARWAAALPIAIAVLLAAAVGTVPVLLGLPPTLGLPGTVACLLVAAVFVPLLRAPVSARWRIEWRAVTSALVCMPVLYWAVFAWELPRLGPVWIAPRVVAMLPPGRLGAVGYAEPSLMFLAGTGTEWLRADEGAAALRTHEVASLLVGERDLPAVLADLARVGRRPEQAATIRGYNYSRGRFTTLTLLVPEQ